MTQATHETMFAAAIDEFGGPVARTFPLDRAEDALRALDERYLGKLALRPRHRTRSVHARTA
jgi:hypothetical protein